MARRKEERERERERGRERESIVGTCVKYDPLGRVRVLDIQRVFLTRYHPFLPFLFFFFPSFFPDVETILDSTLLEFSINLRSMGG